MAVNLRTFINFLWRNNKLQTYLFFFMISFVLWGLTNLSQIYQYRLTVPVKYTHVTDGILSQNLPKDSLQIDVQANGYQLIKLKIWAPVFLADIQKLQIKNHHKWRPDAAINELEEILGKEIKILDLKPEFIDFRLKNIRKKKVKIQLDLTINYELGYKNKQNINITPDSLWIFGMPEVLQNIDIIRSRKTVLNNISGDIEEKVDLILPEKVKSNLKKVTFTVDVDQFIELQESYNLQLINAPSNANILLFPDKVMLKYKVFKSDYKLLKSKKILVRLDYQKRDTVLYPELINVENHIFDTQIYPDKIAFLIKK